MKKTAVFSFVISALLGGVALHATVIATVNGYPITLKEANAFVKVATKGKATYTQLSKKDRQRVIKAVATDKLVMKMASKELSKKEKEAVYVDFYVRKNFKTILKKAEKELNSREKEAAAADLWVRKKSASVKVTDEEIKKVYDKNKKLFKNRKTGKIAPFEKVRPLIYMQLKQKKFVAQLVKKAKIDYNPKSKKSKKTETKKKNGKKNTKKKEKKQ